MRNRHQELTVEELGSVVGGSIWNHYAAVNLFVSPLDRVSLNPQPLPPMPPEMFLQFGR